MTETAEKSPPSIIGAIDNRAAWVAAFKGIQRSPWVRQHLGRALSAHNTHTRDAPLPHPVQRQAFGGSWADPTRFPLLKILQVVFQTWIILVGGKIRGAALRASCGDWPGRALLSRMLRAWHRACAAMR